MYGKDRVIPSGEAVNLSKTNRGLVTTDTCNGARLLSYLLANAVSQAVNEKIKDSDSDSESSEVLVLTQDCHHHLQSIWIGAVVK